MRFLVIHVVHEIIELAVTDRKSSVTSLPKEVLVIGPLGFDPSRRCLFDFLQQLRLADGSCQPGGNVNMIGCAANALGLAPAIAADGCQIGVHSRSNGWIQPRAAVLGAEDDVEDDLAERLGHVVTL